MKKKTKKDIYLNNPNLPAVGATFEFTPEMVEDLKRCKDDIIYFAENFFYIVNPDTGKQKIPLYEYQKKALQMMKDNRFTMLLFSRQTGKALDVDTPIPTPNGFVRMGDLKAGDEVYDENGKAIKVLFAHDVMHNRDCYEIVFDNGEKIVADGEHLWFTQTAKDRNKKTAGAVRTTKDIIQTLTKYNSSTEPNHRIPCCLNGISNTSKVLPIDPYVLGLWLGDGATQSASITSGERYISELLEILSNRAQFNSINCHKYDGAYAIRPTVSVDKKTHSLETLLKQYNLKGNKHIPAMYFLSSREQRLELLQGLMDSDGYIDKKGIAYFYNTNIELTHQVLDLVKSLGYKTTLRFKQGKLHGVKHKQYGIVLFKPREYVCKLSFKRDRIELSDQLQSHKRNQYHYIKQINKVESRPVRCITVDSPTSLYLAGKHYIPTHNSTISTILCLWHACFRDDQTIIIVANKEATAKAIFKRMRLAYEMLPNWLKPACKEYGKESMELANGSHVSITTTTGTAGRGSTANVLFVDEVDWIEPNMLSEFWASVYPIISASKKAKIVMASTPRDTSGLFYKLYQSSLQPKSAWKSMKITWDQVPGRDEQWRQDTIQSLSDPSTFSREFECVAGNTQLDIENANISTIEQVYKSL